MAEAAESTDNFVSVIKASLKSGNPETARQKLNEWRNSPVNIAIVGAAAVGKSFFINTIRDVEVGDPGAAKVGYGNTTTEPTPYEHPKYPDVKYWDLPGVGTPRFPKSKEYMELIKADRYDFILIFFCTTIQETDVWLAKELEHLEKPLAFVRTKIDEVRHSHPKNIQQGIEDSKKAFELDLEKEGIISRVYAISSLEPSLGDMDNLISDMKNTMAENKRLHIQMSLACLTRNVVDDKRDALLQNVWKAAAVMALWTGIPIPGIDFPINIAVLEKEIDYYLKVFNLDADSLAKLPPVYLPRLKTCSKLKEQGVKGFLVMAVGSGLLAGLGATIEVMIPVLGSIITGTAAYKLYGDFLRLIIRELAEDARVVLGLQLGRHS